MRLLVLFALALAPITAQAQGPVSIESIAADYGEWLAGRTGMEANTWRYIIDVSAGFKR